MAYYFVPCPHCGSENRLQLGVDWRPVTCQICLTVMGPKPSKQVGGQGPNRFRLRSGMTIVALVVVSSVALFGLWKADTGNDRRVQQTMVLPPPEEIHVATFKHHDLLAQPLTSTPVNEPLAKQSDLAKNLAVVENYLAVADIRLALETLYNLQERFSAEEDRRLIQGQIQKNVADYAQRLESLGDWAQLASIFQLLTTLDPKYPPYAFKLAQAQMALGNYQEAIQSVHLLQFDYVWREKADKVMKEAARKQNMSVNGVTNVPLIPHGEGFLLSVTLNQKIIAHLLLDTGASMTIISPAILAKLDLLNDSLGQVRMIQTANGRVEILTVIVDELSVQDRTLSTVRVGVLQETEFSGFDGLLGMDFLSHYQFEMDPADKKLYLSQKN